jgi:hypothetical protein
MNGLKIKGNQMKFYGWLEKLFNCKHNYKVLYTTYDRADPHGRIVSTTNHLKCEKCGNLSEATK